MIETATIEKSIFQSATGKSERVKKLQSLTPKSTSNQKSQSLTGQFSLFRHYYPFSLNWSHYVFLLSKGANIHAREYQLYQARS